MSLPSTTHSVTHASNYVTPTGEDVTDLTSFTARAAFDEEISTKQKGGEKKDGYFIIITVLYYYCMIYCSSHFVRACALVVLTWFIF